ncbi:MAG: Trk system potassium transporter TrkA [Thermoanaerobaculales bacterium]|jgi:trk system potassium uptake protein TrkA|nr:Trk system potassium transporter TrkA [Thermoanaerobaculales bacterium]
MRVIVVGGGLVGSTLAARLASDGHDVVLVEQSRDLVAELNERIDVQVICGNGATVPVLEEAGITACDMLLATTDSDEVNMVVALVGSQIYRVPKVIARLRHPGHEVGFRQIAGADVERVAINPELAAVEKIMSLMPVPGAVDVVSFFADRLLIAGFVIRQASEFNGLLLSHLRLLFPATPVLVVALRRDGEWRVPHGDDEIRAGDLVYFAIDPAELDNVLALLGHRRGGERRVMIAGATRVGIELARRLESDGASVTLVEPGRERAEEAAGVLGDTMVIHGSATDRSLLEEEGADRVDGFVACADDHEANVVACLLARKLGAAHTFALVDNPALVSLIADLGIDAVISPRLLSVGLALHFARTGHVTKVAALLDDAVEAFEVEAPATSRLTRAPLAGAGLPRGILVAAVERGERILVPGGADRIEPGEKVLLVATSEMASRIDDILER